MILELKKLIYENWDNWQFELPKPNELIFAKLSSRDSQNGALPILVFLDYKEEPILFMKIARNIDSSKLIKTEFNNINGIRDLISVDKFLLNTIPEPLCLENINGYLILLEKPKIGKNFGDIIPKSKNRRDERLSLIIKWIVRYNLETAKSNLKDNVGLIITYLDNIFSEFNNSPVLKDPKYKPINNSVSNIKENIIRFINNYSVPSVCEHGDFCPYNIIIDGKKNINVIDWEDAIINGLPGIDLWHFIISYYLRLNKKNKNKLINNFLSYEQCSEWIKKMIDVYCSEMKISREYLWYCLPVTLIRAANRDASSNRKHIYRSANWINMLLQYVNLNPTSENPRS